MKSLLTSLSPRFSYLCLLSSILSTVFVAYAEETDVSLTAKKPSVMARSNNNFGVNLLKQIAKKDVNENVFISPISISTAMAIIYHGSKGPTKDELHRALSLSGVSDDEVKKDWRSVLQLITGQLPNGYSCSLANMVMIEKEFYNFLIPDFKTTVENFYYSGIQKLDLSNTKEALRVVNDFVKQKTNNKIEKILDFMDPLTKLVIVSTVYFKNKWKREFPKSDTSKDNFKNYGKKDKNIDFMHLKDDFDFAEIPFINSKIIEIPYKDDRQSIYIILPNNGNIPALVNVITTDLIDNSIVHALKKTYIDLSMPRFKMMSNYSLIPYMKGLGANKMFKVGADLSGVAGRKDLFVSDIVHRTLIGLNEEGTEAFSATAGEEESLVSGFDEKEPIELKINSPFMYIIRDNTNSVILFIGVITNL